MKRLFDASALLNILRMLGEKTLAHIKGAYILSLTPYEIGNALWKEATLLNRISFEEATHLLSTIEFLLRYLNMVDPQNKQLVLEIAHKLKVTYYDASYIVTAAELDAELVTDDSRLRKRIEEGREILRKIITQEIALCTSTEIAVQTQ